MARELAGHRMAAEEPVRGIGERLARPVDARRVRRNQPSRRPNVAAAATTEVPRRPAVSSVRRDRGLMGEPPRGR